VDKRADIWAFGCVLYEMLTGASAFGGDDDTVSDVVGFVRRISVRRHHGWTFPGQSFGRGGDAVGNHTRGQLAGDDAEGMTVLP
jgi:serine/threonine protein kinase